MYYLRHGLFFEESDFGDLDRFSFHAYTEDLDRWYDYRAGRVSSGTKPTTCFRPAFKQLVNSIADTKKRGFSTVTTLLLSLDDETEGHILDGLSRIRALHGQDGEPHSITFVFKGLSLLLVLFVTDPPSPTYLSEMAEYCDTRMYGDRLDRCVEVFFIRNRDGKHAVDFRFTDKPWKPDPKREEAVRRFREQKYRSHIQTMGTPGRNDPCPCGSGLKFKKCHGGISPPHGRSS
jgi:hypothetical protein